MQSKLYTISRENIETLLKYYDSVNIKIKKNYNNILKYKDYTTEYCSKIEELFKEEKNIFNLNDNNIHDDNDSDNIEDNYEIIEIDYVLNNNNSNNKSNKGKTLKKNIEIGPVMHVIEKLNSFFIKFTGNLQSFIKDLEIPLLNLNQCIEVTNNEINSIKNIYTLQQKNFALKYSEFKTLNNELKKEYREAERKLIEFCLEKKKKIYNIQGLRNLEKSLTSSIEQTVQNQNNILEKFNSLGDFGRIFNDSSFEKINIIKDFISSLFQKFEIFTKNMYNFFKKSFMTPMGQLMTDKNEINIKNEIQFIKEFDKLLNSYVQPIDKKYINLHLNEYEIKVVTNKMVYKDEICENRVIMNEILHDFSYETNNHLERDYLEDEEIYFIVKTMSNKFQLIDKKSYNLEIEKKKYDIRKIVGKLTSFIYKNKNIFDIDYEGNDIDSWNFLDMDNDNDNEEKNKENNENKNGENIINDNKSIISNNIRNSKDEITQEDIQYLCKLMSDKVYRNYFLLQINNFRTLSAFELPFDIINFLTQIFIEISKYLCIVKNDENNDIIVDNTTSKLVIILSQTFYYKKDGKKIYIQNELKKERLFQMSEFWSKNIKKSIEDEIVKVLENSKQFENKSDNKESEKEKKSSVAFTQIVSFMQGLNGYGINEEKIKNIVDPLIDEYNIPSTNKQIIYDLIENQNDK